MYLENEVLVREKLRGKILLPNNLENSYKTEKDSKDIIFNGRLYEIHFNYEGKSIYCNASLNKSELSTKNKSKVKIRKIFPPSLLIEQVEKSYKKKIWNFDTEWPTGPGNKSYFLVIYNGKLASDTKASEDTCYQRGYRQLLKERALGGGIKLEDDLLNNIFNNLDEKILEFFNQQ